jgi:diguanylate cyclase (GGDEF)-like protein
MSPNAPLRRKADSWLTAALTRFGVLRWSPVPHPQMDAFLEEQFRLTRGHVQWAMVVGATVLILRGLVDLENHTAAPIAIEMGWRLIMATALFAIIFTYRKARSLISSYRIMTVYVVILVFSICGTLHLHMQGRAAYTLMPITLIYLIVAAIWPQTKWMLTTLILSSMVVLELFFHHILEVHDQRTYAFYLVVGTVLGIVLRRGRTQTAFDNFLMRRHLANQAMSDPLTGTLNRSGWDNRLSEFLQSGNAASPASVLFFDLDHFKLVNDEYGHAIGDLLIQRVSTLIAQSLRETDVLARFGGEEFVVFLPGTNQDDAMLVAERIRLSIANNTVPVSITVSIGVAAFRAIDGVEAALSRADQSLLKAKTDGRNRVIVADGADCGNQS